jgi:hypothetical protein
MRKLTLLLFLCVSTLTQAQVDYSVKIDTSLNVSRETISKTWSETLYEFKQRYNVSNSTLAAWFTSELRSNGKNYTVSIEMVQRWERGQWKPSKAIRDILIPLLIEKSLLIWNEEKN